MSKKQNQKDPSGFIFDLQSNTVLAQGGTFENMKEKINAVRAIVPNRSNNEIILVLQHFDNCVDKTVQAFMEGNASEVLKEWTITGKKKNKKKKSKPKPAAEASNNLPDTNKLASTQEEQSAASLDKGGINGYHVNGAANDTESVDSLSEGLEILSIDARELEDSESAIPDMSDRTGSNIEKSVKDLQRCTVSLARYRVVVKEEMDASIKKMKQAFAELQSCLMDREVALLAEMDKVKAEAMEILLSRQKKAEMLKKMTDVAVRMSEEQLVELRADIKHFVSERKYDEDLGRVARFTCDIDTLKMSIDSFGQVSHPKNSYSTRSRCSSVTSVSLSSPSEAAVLSTSTCASAPSLTNATKKNPPAGEMPAAVVSPGSRPYQPQREVLQGNRRGGQGYRPQGQRSNGPTNQGRHDNVGRYRNGSWYPSGSRYQNAPQSPGNTNERGQAHSAGTNGTAPIMEPSQPSPSSKKGRSGPNTTENKGLPQRKPRACQPEAVNS
ncbi:spermatogenesis-associated serine-rich protein 2 isoform X2 [Monodelphis domestica]|uniref:spermatogenesis-associated serine-rich protein 2 isoform X2 n=1 Tax=Monodelphis domestica TaxID=13616 RepID=UPI0024E1D4C9|nr:spermatogenesis-associated serine-rich protein 2 isoform X2 [Monodelphis domestica]